MDRLKKLDVGILISTLVLVVFGIVFVYSSSFVVAEHRFGGADFFLSRQAFRAVLGLFCFVLFAVIDYHIVGRIGGILYIGSVLLLVYVLTLPEEAAVNGAKRWVTIGFFRMQVSELARMGILIMLAKQLSTAGDRVKEWSVFLKMIMLIGVVCGLVVLEPDFSTAVLIAGISLTVLFVAGARFTHLVGLGLSVIPLAIIAVTSTPYRRQRLTGFLHMENHEQDLGYQAQQALIGLGNGGIFGVGLGQGEQKLLFLPEPHTDFLFSILGEEIGLVGLVIVFAIYGFLIYRGIRVALNAPDTMGRLMAFGFSFAIAVYVMVHAMVNTGLVPTTGVPLPFLSYGGMSLIFTMTAMGILLNISTQTIERPAPARMPARTRPKYKSTPRRIRKNARTRR